MAEKVVPGLGGSADAGTKTRTTAIERSAARRQVRENMRQRFAALPAETQAHLRAALIRAEACIGCPGCDGRPCYCGPKTTPARVSSLEDGSVPAADDPQVTA